MGIIALFSFLISSALASSWMSCDIEAQIITNDKEEAKIKVIKMIRQNDSGFGHCSFKKDQTLKIKIENPEKLKEKKKAIFNYRTYSGMGPNGAVTSTTWTIK